MNCVKREPMFAYAETMAQTSPNDKRLCFRSIDPTTAYFFKL